MDLLIQQLINGISAGSIYAIVALGYTMVYGIIKLINFAHGDVLMVGAFTGLYCVNTLKMPIILAIIASMLVCAVLGAIVEKLAYKPLRTAPRIALLITAIGVSFLIEYLMMYFFGSGAQAYKETELTSGSALHIGNIFVTRFTIYVILSTMIIMILLQLIVKKTKLGKAMRAVSSDKDAAQLMGINVDKTISFTFMLGSALAAIAGVMYGAQFSVQPLMGMQLGLKAFIAAVFGGIGNIPGAMLGGYLLGIIESLGGQYISTTYVDVFAYVILIIVLLVRPFGILGKDTREKV